MIKCFYSSQRKHIVNIIKKNKLIGVLLLMIIYIVATVIGIIFYRVFNKVDTIWRILICDLIATVFVWFAGLILHTSSTYDPYWSLQTIVIGILLTASRNNWNPGNIIFSLIIFIYSARLTANFISTFSNLNYEDWRYRNLKQRFGKWYIFIDLFGICLMPTAIVFFASVPYFEYILQNMQYENIQLIGFVIIACSIIVESISDYQMHSFIKKRNTNAEICRNGLWKNTRHPNYLGEIGVWFGIMLVYAVMNHHSYVIYIGIIFIYLLFRFISIPMAEKHYMEYKKDFKQYRHETFALIILPFGKSLKRNGHVD